MRSGIKIGLFATALAGTLMLSGCKDVSESESSTESSSSTSSESKPQSPSSAESAKPPVIHDPETQALIDEFPYDTFTGFDGEEVKKTDAVGAMKVDGGMIFLTYDFAYLRYAKPVWKNTLADPNVIDWETYEFDGVPSRNITDPNYFSVKAGDVLANGLTVTEASTTIYPQHVIDENGVSKIDMLQSMSVINFEGQLTLSGVLHCVGDDAFYIETDGDLQFFADPSDGKLLVPSEQCSSPVRLLSVVNPEAEFAICCDGQRFILGNINDENTFDLSGIINRGEYRNVTVTLNNMRIMYIDGGGAYMYGTIVSVDAGD